jgi:hypothetical protein
MLTAAGLPYGGSLKNLLTKYKMKNNYGRIRGIRHESSENGGCNERARYYKINKNAEYGVFHGK